MTTFNDLALEILTDMGTDVDVTRLNTVDQRRLCAAYLRDDPSVIDTVVAAIDGTTLANHLADLIEPEDGQSVLDADWLDLLRDLRRGVFPNKALMGLVQGELDYRFREAS